MNCCDEYGDCNQGRECPVRAGIHPASYIPPDAGNFYLPEPEPLPLTTAESVTFWCAIGLSALVSIGIIAGIAGYFYSTFFGA